MERKLEFTVNWIVKNNKSGGGQCVSLTLCPRVYLALIIHFEKICFISFKEHNTIFSRFKTSP